MNFYDKVAQKFGDYHSNAHAKFTKVFPGLDPEEVFKTKLLEVSGKDKTALDVGCADGRFTISMAPNFQTITAIDTSIEMLSVARKRATDAQLSNIEFLEQDASKTDLTGDSFDIVYSRRGPTYYAEFFQVLKLGGYCLYIGIGEKDAMDLKLIFGRGQDYEKIDKSASNTHQKEMTDTGFKILYCQEFTYYEYYASFEDLRIFLETVPIFTDFNPEKDRLFLEKYAENHTSDKGILLNRHRFVLVGQKLV